MLITDLLPAVLSGECPLTVLADAAEDADLFELAKRIRSLSLFRWSGWWVLGEKAGRRFPHEGERKTATTLECGWKPLLHPGSDQWIMFVNRFDAEDHLLKLVVAWVQFSLENKDE